MKSNYATITVRACGSAENATIQISSPSEKTLARVVAKLWEQNLTVDDLLGDEMGEPKQTHASD